MNIQGQIIKSLGVRQGTSGQGKQWRSATYVLQVPDQYKHKMLFEVLGERIERFALKEGDNVAIDFEIDAHEWNGKWFNTIKAWNAERTSAPVAQQQSVLTQPQYNHQGPAPTQTYQQQGGVPY